MTEDITFDPTTRYGYDQPPTHIIARCGSLRFCFRVDPTDLLLLESKAPNPEDRGGPWSILARHLDTVKRAAERKIRSGHAPGDVHLNAQDYFRETRSDSGAPRF